MKKLKYLGILLAAVIFLTGVLPAPVRAATDVLTLKWLRSTESESGPTHHSYMDPLTVDKEGNVYVCHMDGYLYVYTPEKKLKWKVDLRQFSHDDKYDLALGPVLDEEGNCYIASRNQKVYKIDTQGNVLATYQMSGEVASSTSPVLAPDGTLYVVTDSQILYAFDSSDLSKKWQVKIKGGFNAITPVLAGDGTVIAGSLSTITAVYPASGDVAWEYELTEDRILYQHYSQGFPKHEKRMQVDGDGNIYFLTIVNREDQNELMCLKSDGSEILWQKSINTIVSEPALKGDTLYYCTSDSRLHAVNAANGSDKWELYIDAEGSGMSSRAPAIAADGKIYFHMGGIVGVVQDEETAGALLGKCKLPSKKNADVCTGAVSRLGPNGEFYVGYEDVNLNYWLAKIVDNSFEPQPADIEISAEEKAITMAVGGAYSPELQLLDTNGVVMDQDKLVFTSTNPLVISTSGGMLSALQAGSAEVKITHPDNAALEETISVTVLGDLSGSGLEITTSQLEISVDQTLQLTARLLSSVGSLIKGEALEWSSSNAAVAKVSSTGQLSGEQAGTAKVNVRLKNQQSITSSVVVTVKDDGVEKVTLEEINQKITRTVNYYKGQGAPGTDWSAFALNAVGVDLSTLVNNGSTYLDILEAKAKQTGYFSLMTDYERTVIGIVSAGGDPADFAGMNLLEKIYNYSSLSQGINAAVFGLVALDAANASIPADAVHNRDSLISFILQNMVGDGWCYGGTSPDPDMTGMALYALAPYRDRPLVKAAGEKAINWLSEHQNEYGVMESGSTESSESCAQALMGITAWEVDPQGELFTKQNGNLVTGLLSFYFEDSGMFGHVYGSPDPAMATDQGLEGLAALKDFMVNGCSDIFYKISSVSGEPREISALEISPEGLQIPPGCEVQLQVVDQSGIFVDNDAVNWSSSDSSIASIDEVGTLTAVKAGKIQVTVSLKETASIKDTISVEVFGEEFEITRTENPANLFGVNKTITHSVSNVTDEDETVVMIITLISNDTKEMVYSSYVTEEIAAGETAELSGAVNIPSSGDYKVNVMLWNGWDKLRPIVDSVVE